MSLKYNEIGKTGMKVARLAFGASSLGGVFHTINETEAQICQEEAHEAVFMSQRGRFAVF